ncbi:MAG: signal peptidase I [Elusimicrobiota bacterium]
MKRLLLVILIGVLLAVLFRRYCFEVVYIASPSMESAYSVKDELIINKLAYLFKDPERGDIVLLYSPLCSKDMVKRIVGLPGEELSIKEKQVYIDGKPLEEKYADYVRSDEILVGDNIDVFIIPKNHYFVMGDNRDVSRDSRDWLEEKGLQKESISISCIKGKAFTLIKR